MKLISCMVCLLAFLVPGASLAAPLTDGLVVLEVSSDNVNVRAQPYAKSEVITALNSGTMLVAEKWPSQDRDTGMAWYRIIGLADKGQVISTLQIKPMVYFYPYVSANYVKPVTGHEDLLAQVVASPYGQGYNAVDNSAEAQRRMAEQRTVKSVRLVGKDKIAVYSQPSTSSELKGHYSVDIDNALVVVDDSQPGWLLLVDLRAEMACGWVEAKLLEAFHHKNNRDVANLAALNLGANLPQIMERWAQVGVMERRAEEVCPGCEDYIDISIITGDGFDLFYQNYRVFRLTLNRTGAGLTGIFVNTQWCDKQYVENTYGAIFNITKEKQDDNSELWHWESGSDGWKLYMSVTFNDKGLVEELRCISAVEM